MKHLFFICLFIFISATMMNVSAQRAIAYNLKKGTQTTIDLQDRNAFSGQLKTANSEKISVAIENIEKYQTVNPSDQTFQNRIENTNRR